MSLEHSASFAEVLVSPDYRAALNTAYEQSADNYQEQQLTAEQIIFMAIREQRTTTERAWEARRQAAITEAYGTDLGAFNDYIQEQDGHTTPAELTLDDLDKGAPEVVRTNSRILSINKTHEDPIDFLEDAVSMIEGRRRQNSQAIGPENYATSLKFFSDRMRDLPTIHLDSKAVSNAVNHCLRGFIQISEKDKPNFVEMTNLYAAINALPADTVDKRYSQKLVIHSLEQLPTYNRRTLATMVSALGKLDLSTTGESSAELIDLAFRKGRAFDTTSDMLYAARATANLPRTPAANRCFRTFLDMRNNLEQPMDITAIEFLNSRLLKVVGKVIDDPGLSQDARDLASRCTVRAVGLFRRARQNGTLTPEQLDNMQTAVRRISDSFSQI